MKKYEYKVISKGRPAAINAKKYDEMAQELEQELNVLGAEGWQFIQWQNTMMIFKREIK